MDVVHADRLRPVVIRRHQLAVKRQLQHVAKLLRPAVAEKSVVAAAGCLPVDGVAVAAATRVVTAAMLLQLDDVAAAAGC